MSDDGDALERQADALEAIATELRYQNAALVEVISSLDEVARRVDDHTFSDGPAPERSGTALQTWIQDRLFERDEAEDRVPDYRKGNAENWGDA